MGEPLSKRQSGAPLEASRAKRVPSIEPMKRLPPLTTGWAREASGASYHFQAKQ